MEGLLRNSKLEVFIDGYDWVLVNASIDETNLILSPVNDEFSIPPSTWNSEKRFVKIQKREGHNLGISIQGGADNNKPIVISKIFPGTPAEQVELYVGDIILAVDGESLINSTHAEAVRALKESGKSTISLQVQYSRDHLNKNSALQRISWDDATSTTPLDSKEFTRNFGLKLAFVSKGSLDQEDIENRLIEMRSQSGRNILMLRCANSEQRNAWFEAIHSCSEALLIQALAQVNLILGQNPQVYKMGWLVKQENEFWKPLFAALTKHDLLFYDCVPTVKHEWACPQTSLPLISTRIVQTTARSFPIISGLSDVISFTTRTGTQKGITTYLFRLVSHRDLASWVKSIVENTYEACTDIGQVTAPCTWQDRSCEFIISLNGGGSLSLVEERSQELIWQFPFEEIRASGDYENHFLWLDFGHVGREHELEMISSPKAVVFILHSFLATKIHQLGLYA